MSRFAGVKAVTFDCWGTLIVDRDPQAAAQIRAAAISDACTIPQDEAATLLAGYWSRHHDEWVAGRQAGSVAMVDWICSQFGLDGDVRPGLLHTFEETARSTGIMMVDGALPLLSILKERGFATALICDTGFTPGRVVRDVLTDMGLARHLDVLVFSDEVGVPKPDSKMFKAASIEGFAVHVGDLRRTDAGGARAFGWGSVRVRGVYDDTSDHPDADVVIDSLSELPGLVGL